MTRPFIENFVELHSYLSGAMQRTRPLDYLPDTENTRRFAAFQAFSEVRELIVPMVTAELADRAQKETADVL